MLVACVVGGLLLLACVAVIGAAMMCEACNQCIKEV